MKSLLAAGLAVAAVLAAAPAAQANWITGMGNLPLMRSDAICPDGMDFQYATYVSSKQAQLLDRADARQGATMLGGGPAVNVTLPPPPPITLQGLGIWVENPDGSIDPNPVVAPSDISVPWRPLLIEPLSGVNWTGYPGQLTHTAQLWLNFNRTLAPGTRVHVGQGTLGPATPSLAQWSLPVSYCLQKVIAGPAHLAPVGP